MKLGLNRFGYTLIAIGLAGIAASVAPHHLTGRQSAAITEADAAPVTRGPSAAPIHSFAAGLTMISVPSDYSGQSLASVLGYSSPLLAVWNPTSNAYDLTPTPPADSLAVGQGYWVRFPGPESITALGTPTPTNTPFNLPIQAGWNLVGDPFPSSIALSSTTLTPQGGAAQSFASAVQHGLLEDTLFTFEAGDTAYEVVAGETGSLTPYLGYWMFASNGGTLSIPPPVTPTTVAIPVVNDPSAPMGFSFHSPVSVHSGDTVFWTDDSSAPHGITWDAQTPSSSPAPGANIPIFSPGGNSGNFVAPNVSAATTYHYHCTIHGPTMPGQIIVSP